MWSERRRSRGWCGFIEGAATGVRTEYTAAVHPIQRLKQSLRAALDGGFSRLVLARTGGGGEQVIEGGAPLDDAARELLVGNVLRAAKDGFVKITLVRADGGRVVLDARHGSAREIGAAEAAEKGMAGKARGLRPDTNGPLLRVLGIQNADGTISAQNAKKYKQVSHLVELLRPAWEAAAKRGVTEASPLRVLDLACGNAYLSFVLADALRVASVPFRIHGVDVREDLVARCVQRAAELGLPGLEFSQSTIAGAADLAARLGGPPDLVLALHACDGATDEALATAQALGATALFVVPCCQAEVAAEMKRNRGGPTPAYRHGMLLREHASTLTDALRVDWLEAQGFAVDVVEFVDAGHTPKNRLLRAARARRPDAAALAAWLGRCDTLGAHPSGLLR